MPDTANFFFTYVILFEIAYLPTQTQILKKYTKYIVLWLTFLLTMSWRSFMAVYFSTSFFLVARYYPIVCLYHGDFMVALFMDIYIFTFYYYKHCRIKHPYACVFLQDK